MTDLSTALFDLIDVKVVACGAVHPRKTHVTCIRDAGHDGTHARYADGGGDIWAVVTLPVDFLVIETEVADPDAWRMLL